MYTTVDGTTYISGDFGKYDNKIKNNSARYGRNSVDNFKKYLANYTQPLPDMSFDTVDFTPKSRFKLVNKISFFFKKLKFKSQMKKLEKQIQQMKENEDKRTPLDFVQKYMPGNIKDGNIDKTALMAAAYEEMGAASISTKELTDKMQSAFSDIEEMSAESLDINKDGQIDIAEYSTSILLSDALSFPSEELSTKNINGIVTKDGENEALAYAAKKNKDIAYKTYSYLYNHYNLSEAQEEFLGNKNNTKTV